MVPHGPLALFLRLPSFGGRKLTGANSKQRVLRRQFKASDQQLFPGFCRCGSFLRPGRVGLEVCCKPLPDSLRQEEYRQYQKNNTRCNNNYPLFG